MRLMRMIDAASERQDRLVGEVLVSVPDDWLIPDAPECHVDHVREDRYGEVIAAIQEARAGRLKKLAEWYEAAVSGGAGAIASLTMTRYSELSAPALCYSDCSRRSLTA